MHFYKLVVHFACLDIASFIVQSLDDFYMCSLVKQMGVRYYN